MAPNAPLRMQVTALARQPPAPPPDAALAPHAPVRSPAHYLWALLLARIYEMLPLRCVLCGGQMRIIAFVIDVPALTTILAHLGEPTAPPEVVPARGPPLERQPAQPHWDDTPAPPPEFVFDQRLGW